VAGTASFQTASEREQGAHASEEVGQRSAKPQSAALATLVSVTESGSGEAAKKVCEGFQVAHAKALKVPRSGTARAYSFSTFYPSDLLDARTEISRRILSKSKTSERDRA
jgi:hypothetical protein